MSSLQGQTFAGYEIIAKLGQGGMGAVFKARQPNLDRLAALKIMTPDLASDPDFVARFKREAAAAASLSHPNVVQVYSAGESEGTHYIAMEFVDGQTLRDHIVQNGRLDPREAVAITVYVAEALQYAWNRAKLIHRDIKPENIFLSKAGEVKVGDLGLAKTVGGQTTSLTQTGTAMGSPHYISPEQATGAKDMDFRTDIYSLGGTLYHMLTGQTPYSGDSSMVVMMKHVNEPPPAIFKAWPQCPMPLGLLVGKMLAKNRNSRPASYEELIEQLRALHDKLKPATVPAAAPVSPSDPTQRLTPTPRPAPAPAQPTPKPVITKTPTVAPKARESKSVTRNSRLVIGASAFAAVALIASAVWWFVGRAGEESGGTKLLNLGGGVKMELVAIPPGELVFGNNPPRRAAIREQFWLGRTEVTVGQWKQFADATGYQTHAEKNDGAAHWCPQGPGKGTVGAGTKGTCWRTLNVGFPLQDNHPVACITWGDAMAFCEWLTEQERKAGRLRPGHVLRLPTEVEWEYACRAGTTTKFWWGDDVNDGEGRVNWGGAEDGFEFMSPVDHFGERGRNQFGLADMLGNVAELCLDCYDESGTSGTPRCAPRGGSFAPGRGDCSTRNPHARSELPYGPEGFRVCLGPNVPGSAAPSAPVAPAAAAASPKFGVLFDGRDTSAWQQRDGGDCQWEVRNGALVAGKGDLDTREKFQDFKLHVEFAVSRDAKQGNSGIYLQGRYEVQILDSYGKPADDICCGSIFRLKAPTENASKPADEWQTFDIGFRAAQFDASGAKTANARVSVLHNGKLIHDYVEIPKSTGKGEPESAEPGPIRLQAYGSPVRFRNISIKPVDEVAAQTVPEGFVSLFNGKDLTGWEGRPEFWSVQDGAICGATTKETRAQKNTFLVCTAGEFGDFELRAQFKLATGNEQDFANSGIQYRSRIIDREYFTLSGYQADLGASSKKNLCGGFWDEASRNIPAEPGQRLILREGASPKSPKKTIESLGSAADILASYKENDWNDLVIIASGNRLQHYLNGKLASEVIDETAAAAKTGTLALQIKSGPPMRVWFRNLFIKKLGSAAQAGEAKVLDLGGSAKMELVAIPPGEFMLGSTKEERAWARAETAKVREGDQPRRTRIKNGFWLGRTEVTVGQWKQFVAATGYKTDAEKRGYVDFVVPKGGSWGRGNGLSWRDPGHGEPPRDGHPVCAVSWNDAMAFCGWLTERERNAGRLPAGCVVRLPAEAEWEYACRAGTQTRFWWGDEASDGKDRLNGTGEGDGFYFVAPVDHYGERGRNAFGLADMLGNVLEWCLDDCDVRQANEDCYKGNPKAKALRGGSFNRGYQEFRCAARFSNLPDHSSYSDGFRVCLGSDVLGSAPADSAIRNPQSAITPDAAWQNAINLLPLIDPQKDAVHGQWERVNAELISDKDNYSRIEIPYQPSEEYDYLVEFSGSGIGGCQLLAKAGHEFRWACFARNAFAFDTVNGMDIHVNATRREMFPMERGRHYVSMVEVRNNGLRAFLDGKLVTAWPTTYADMDVPERWKLRGSGLLGVGSQTRTIFHRIEVREVTGKGTFTRGAPASADAGWQNAINLLPLVDLQKDAVHGTWTFEKGDLVSDKATQRARIEIPYRPPSEYDLRVTFTRREGADSPNVILAQPGRQFVWEMDAYSEHVFGFSRIDGTVSRDNPSGVKRSKGLDNGRQYRTVIQVRNGQLKAYLDDELITQWSGDPTRLSFEEIVKLHHADTLGLVTWESPVAFHKIELLEVTGKGTFTRGAPSASSAAAGDVVNLLALASVPRDAVYGNWSVTADGLAVERREGATALEFPYDVPEEYDYEIEFTPQGNGMNVNQYLSAGGHAFAWKLNSHGVSPPVYGLDLLDGKYAKDHLPEAAVQKPMPIEAGKRYTSKFEVRRGSLRALVNGEEYMTWSGDFNRLSMEPHTKMKDERHLGVGSWRRGVVFHRAELRKVGQTGGASGSAPDAGWQNAINLLPLIDPQKDAVQGTWTVANGELVSDSAAAARIEIPYQPPEEYDFRVAFTRVSGNADVMQALSKAGRSFIWVMGGYDNKYFGFCKIGNGASAFVNNPSAIKADACLTNGRRYTARVEVRNEGLKAYLDDMLLTQWKTDYSDMVNFPNWTLRNGRLLGLCTGTSPTIFHRIEVREVTGKGTFTRTPPRP